MLSLKGSQGNLYDEVKTFPTSALSPDVASISYDGGQGRIETHSLRMAADIHWLQEQHEWVGL